MRVPAWKPEGEGWTRDLIHAGEVVTVDVWKGDAFPSFVFRLWGHDGMCIVEKPVPSRVAAEGLSCAKSYAANQGLAHLKGLQRWRLRGPPPLRGRMPVGGPLTVLPA